MPLSSLAPRSILPRPRHFVRWLLVAVRAEAGFREWIARRADRARAATGGRASGCCKKGSGGGQFRSTERQFQVKSKRQPSAFGYASKFLGRQRPARTRMAAMEAAPGWLPRCVTGSPATG